MEFRKNKNGDPHPITPKKVRDISDDDVNVEVNVTVDEDELEKFASEKAMETGDNVGVKISDENYYFKTDDDGSISLGLDDFGWTWRGDQDDLMSFFIRLAHSKRRDKFANDFENANMNFDKLKPRIMKSLELDSGLYEITGDNTRWKFGDDEFDNEGDLDGIDEWEELSDDEKKKVMHNLYIHYGIDYDEFMEQYGKDIKEKLKEKVKRASNMEELLDDLADNDLSQSIDEDFFVYESSQNYGAFKKALEEIKK